MRGLYELAGAVEALLFVKGDPMTLKALAEAMDESPEDIVRALSIVEKRHDEEGSGIMLHKSGAGYSLATQAKYHDWLSALLGKETPLSPSAMETLAVVACKEPVTRAEIEKIRGVSAGRILASLTDKGLIEERGRLDVPSRPILYGTTSRFLKCTGLSGVEELQTLWADRMRKDDEF